MKLPYFKIPHTDPKKKFLQVPWIEVSVRANDNKTTFLMLIDSGADISIFDRDIATFLGLKLDDGELVVTSGIGGTANVYYFDNIHIEVGGHSVKIRCGFVEGPLADGKLSGVLGREGFFEQFKVCVDEKHKEIELKENK